MLNNLAEKFVAGWLLPSKVLDLSYPTPFSFCNTKSLRVKAHAHARIFAWLLGTCISETTADIAGNQTSMPEDQRELYTMQTTSAKVSRRQRHRGG